MQTNNGFCSKSLKITLHVVILSLKNRKSPPCRLMACDIQLYASFVTQPPFIDSFGTGPLPSQYQSLPSMVRESFKHILDISYKLNLHQNSLEFLWIKLASMQV